MEVLIFTPFALLCFFVGYVYLFNHDLAAKWDNSRRKVLGQNAVERTTYWKNRARLRGVMSIAAGLLCLAFMLHIL